MRVKTTNTPSAGPGRKDGPRLEIVLKCDSAGSVEAVSDAVSWLVVPDVGIAIVRSGVGPVSKSDVLLAETASGLIAGFQVNVVAGLEGTLREHGVEVRLYDVIYRLTEDIKNIAESLVPALPEEEILGSGNVVAFFKSSRKGIIVGCEITSGRLSTGQHFRIISQMGPVYAGIIESLHIGETVVQKAMPGQKAGIKIANFNKARVGDIVESYRPLPLKQSSVWEPSGRILKIGSGA